MLCLTSEKYDYVGIAYDRLCFEYKYAKVKGDEMVLCMEAMWYDGHKRQILRYQDEVEKYILVG